MAVRIRLKKMGRAHRPFYRVCAFDHRAPRDGRALEELGTYDTSLQDTHARAVLNAPRIDYWLSVGAQPTEKVAVLIKKYGTDGTHLEQQKAALEALAAPKSVPAPGVPASLPKKAEEPAAATGSDTAGSDSPEASGEKDSSEEAGADKASAESTDTADSPGPDESAAEAETADAPATGDAAPKAAE